MSKIVKALDRAAQLRAAAGGQLVMRDTAGDVFIPREALSHAPVLATEAAPTTVPEPAEITRSMEAIARMREERLLSSREREVHKLIIPEPTFGNPVECFRSLRTQIMQRLRTRRGVIMVASVCARGGASFVSANLAVAHAFDTARTALLIDGNLRRPAFGQLIRSHPYFGLVDYLEDPALTVADILHPVGIERLRVIPAGEHVRESIVEYFGSARMLALLQELRGRYPERIIVFDAPPMTDSADTRILSGLCDGVVLVVPYGRVRIETVNDCLREIGAERLLGIVFNDEPPSPSLFWNELREPWVAAWRRWRAGGLRRMFARGH